MFTSSFFTYFGEGRISISRGNPENIDGYKFYRNLNPGPWFKDKEFKDVNLYRNKYHEDILSKLDPQQTWDELHKLVENENHCPVLLCYEKLNKKNEWCHRRMAAEWLQTELGVIIPEWREKEEPLPLLDLMNS